jgi:hypothetical protein
LALRRSRRFPIKKFSTFFPLLIEAIAIALSKARKKGKSAKEKEI